MFVMNQLLIDFLTKFKQYPSDKQKLHFSNSLLHSTINVYTRTPDIYAYITPDTNVKLERIFCIEYEEKWFRLINDREKFSQLQV